MLNLKENPGQEREEGITDEMSGVEMAAPMGKAGGEDPPEGTSPSRTSTSTMLLFGLSDMLEVRSRAAGTPGISPSESSSMSSSSPSLSLPIRLWTLCSLASCCKEKKGGEHR